MNSKQLLFAAIRSDFRIFLRKVIETVSPNDAYLHNWHIDALAYQLMRLQQGEILRLLATIPPRHLKSITVSVAFVAWLLAHNPKLRIVCISYSDELAEMLSAMTKKVMQSDWYRTSFPGTVLSDLKNTQSLFYTTEQGFRMATTVGGPLTGFGADYMIIDDPHKADDALSDARRQQAVRWFQTTAINRMNQPGKGRVVVVMQRFHTEDLAGVLIEEGGWELLSLPAIAERLEEIPIAPDLIHVRHPGEALHPQRMSLEDLEAMRKSMGSAYFSAQYQQDPVPPGGLIIEVDWFPRYDEAPVPEPGDVVAQSWDFGVRAGDRNDYTVCVTALLRDQRLYVLDVYRGRMEGTRLVRFVPQWANKWQADPIIVEAAGSSLFIADVLIKSNPNRYIPHFPKDDKEMRLGRVAFLIEAGWIVLPEAAPWLQDFLQEIKSFPKGKHDDQVDALSQLLIWAYRRKRQDMRPVVVG